MKFRLLGPLEVRDGEEWLEIGAPKWRSLLAALLIKSGQVVSTDALIDEVWGGSAPNKAANLISIYVLRLRRLMGDAESKMLVTRAPGYQLRLGLADTDAQRFETMLADGRQALTAGNPAQAAGHLAEALALWRGSAFADVPRTSLVEGEAERLAELKLDAAELRITAELACGGHAQVVPELRRLLADNPLREGLWLLLMRALNGSGRHAEALETYGRARAVISDELGIDPGADLRRLYAELLAEDVPSSPGGPAGTILAGTATPGPATAAQPARSAPRAPVGETTPQAATAQPVSAGIGPAGTVPAGIGPAGTGPAGVGPAPAAKKGRKRAAQEQETQEAREPQAEQAAPGAPSRPVIQSPAQLPTDIADFTGRGDQVRHLVDLLASAADVGTGAVRIALVAGYGGLGKTSLAVHAAHLVRDKFPDGQLYVDLLGATSHPLSPPDVLARFLRDLGVDGTQIPLDEAERAARYRTSLAGRRVLVVLDNARDAAQVRSLLPGSAPCAVLITTRSRMPDLASTKLVDLNVLDDDEALTLFTRVVGDRRAAAEPEATAELLDACAGLPLAIRICAARLAARSGWTIRTMANRLRDEHRRLDEMTAGDLAVRASFEVSFASLPAAARRGVDPAQAFRLLGLWTGASVSAAAAAALFGASDDDATDALERLVDFHLLESRGEDRYKFHDLLKVYAAERAVADLPAEDRDAAVARLLGWYMRTAEAAAQAISRYRYTMPLATDAAAAAALSFKSIGDALAWYDTERANLVAATGQASACGLHDVAWRLPAPLFTMFTRRGNWADCIATQRIAAQSARHAGNRQGEAWVLNNLGEALGKMRNGEGVGYLEQALAIRHEIGDRRGEAQAANNLADALEALGRIDEALDMLHRALGLSREAGDRYNEGVALTNLGSVLLKLERAAEAVDYLEQAQRTFRDIDYTDGTGYALHILGRCYLSQGRYADAAEALRQALAGHRVAGSLHRQAVTLLLLSKALTRSGQAADARDALTQAATIFDRLGDADQAAQARTELTDISLDVQWANGGQARCGPGYDAAASAPHSAVLAPGAGSIREDQHGERGVR
jgi:DNA-binding SARP family transcriptional activator/Tfp pilus assembly protein PilF